MRTDDLDFVLPPELIAQTPAADRAASRLLHYRRSDQTLAHRIFSDLPSLLRAGDLLVFNDARVIPARFMLQKHTGGQIEGLWVEEIEIGRWRVLLKNLGTPRPDVKLHFADAPEIAVRVLKKLEGGEYEIEVATNEAAAALLSRLGRMPLPPYIKRDKTHDVRDEEDRQRYQTVFARTPGAVAAPTAALHFTQSLFNHLQDRGVEQTFVTLHVGLGTFKPVSASQLDEHVMHVESYSIDDAAAKALNHAKTQRRRIIAVGTTSARVLESQPVEHEFQAKTDKTGIFIYPPYAWKHVDALITNFHLPRSTLIALVAAMVGSEQQRRLYDIAIKERYRFFSYGDAMFIE